MFCERVATDEVTTLFGDYADNGIIEEDVDNQPNLVQLTLYADASLDPNTIKSDIKGRLNESNIEITSIDAHILDESTWLNSWQQYIEPTEILPNLIIKPAWQEYDNEQNKTIIEIDSDISFGTGSHETTRTCAELLQAYSKSMNLDYCYLFRYWDWDRHSVVSSCSFGYKTSCRYRYRRICS